MRLEINYSEKNRKKHKHMEGKQYVVNNQEITEEVRGNQKIPRDKWQWKHDNLKPMGCSESSSQREDYSNTILPQETRKISNK